MRRRTWWWSLAAMVCCGLLATDALLITAFGPGRQTAAAAEEAAPEGGEAPAEEAAVEEPAAKPATPAEGMPTPQKSMLVWFYESLGLLYTIPFLGLSFSLVALFVMNLLSARRDSICPAALIESFETHLNQEHYQEAYDAARNDESFLGQVLSAGLAKLSTGYSQAIEAMQEVGEEENMKLEHRLSYMALIGTISPMIGLLGTVDGMVRSFSVIALSDTTPKPSKLAEGIATALVTTIVGLWIAIPAIAAYNILKNIVARRVLEVGVISEGLMRAAMENAKKK